MTHHDAAGTVELAQIFESVYIQKYMVCTPPWEFGPWILIWVDKDSTPLEFPETFAGPSGPGPLKPKAFVVQGPSGPWPFQPRPI